METIQRALRGLAITILAIFVAAGLQGLPAQAATGPSKYVEGTDPAAFLYDPLNITSISLTLPDASLRALSVDGFNWNDPTTEVGWQEGSAVFSSYKGTLPSMDIGLHLKGGAGSRRPISTCDPSCRVLTNSKPGIKIKFDFGSANASQRFYGLKEITLNSMVQDPSMIHEMTDYRIARSAGIPAPRAGYMNLVVNGVNLGLHMILETYDKQLFKRWFTTGTSHSYEGAYWQDLILNPTAIVRDYSTLQLKIGDVNTAYTDLRTIATINNLSGVDWWNAINRYADMGELTSVFAFEHFIEHWDAYSWYIINNYQVHFTDDGILTVHPWGLDQTLSNNTSGDRNVKYLDATVGPAARPTGILYSRCLQYTACKLLYQAAIARIGEVSDSINSVGFIDEIWSVIGPTVLADPIFRGSGAAAMKEDAKAFLSTRTQTSEFRSATTGRRLPNLDLYYSPPSHFEQGKVVAPLVNNNTGFAPKYTVLGDSTSPICSVDEVSGAITELNPGNCVVSIWTPAGPLVNPDDGNPGFHSAYAIAYVDLGKIPGSILLPSTRTIAYGVSVPLVFKGNSSGDQTVVASGNCTFANGAVTATTPAGICTLTITVAKDARHTPATATLELKISKEVVTTYSLSTDPNWTNSTKLPKGATLPLVNKVSKIVGSCINSGTTLKALGATGSCKVTIAAWATSTQSFVSKTFTVTLAPNPQVWLQKVALPVAKKKIGSARFTLANTDTVTTSGGQEGFFGYVGNCIVEVTPRATFVQMTGTGVCKVNLDAEAGYKVGAIHRVWTFTK
ncbi:unannotated protein [freshwater metagenome]|uniref:Unannotated protein n=1 Tax=freshwater metagenome TaxID=449393 RepID=A0A6J7KC64_9ZZZZ|nr:hypothetical protein [Actinomycetota bacterium]